MPYVCNPKFRKKLFETGHSFSSRKTHCFEHGKNVLLRRHFPENRRLLRQIPDADPVGRFDLTEDYLPKVFCVQYNETAFNFVSRIMEHEGMYYWWEHDNGKHTMVITEGEPLVLTAG